MDTTRKYRCIARSAAAMLLHCAFLVFAVAHCAFAETSAGNGTDVLKSEVSRSAVTKMPAYTVEESQSTKTHTLFMGADIAINLDRDLYRVQDVFGSNWVIQINGREKEISAKRAPLDLKITPSLKLTETSATIAGFKRVRAYSYANDPSVMLTRGLSKSASMNSDLLANAQNAQNVADASASHSLGGAAEFAGADDQFSANAMMTTAEFAYSDSHPNPYGFSAPSPTAPTTSTSTTGNTVILTPDQISAHIARAEFNNQVSMLNDAITQENSDNLSHQTENGNEPAGRIATGGLDAMDVEFDIRCSKPLRNPYVVTMTRFRPPGAKPGMVQNMVYAQSLHPIDEHNSHVHFVEEGFPFGYELIDFQLHIYNRGEEIATNVAANRVELTRDEAFEYVKAEYIGAHPKDTLPAVPAMGKLPSDLPIKLALGKYSEAFYVSVSKDGLANRAFTDPACTKRIDDPYLESVVGRLRFKPALDNGKPVDGVASLNLSKLTI
jgi:hypothetical protein